MNQQRMTRQKKLVLDIVKSHMDHPTADQIYLEVRDIDNHISRGTVFRNLNQLAEADLILQVKVPGANRFDSRVDHHFHMICKKCGAVMDAPIAYQQEINEEILKKTGFKVTRQRTVYEGLCKQCQNKS